MNLLQRTYLRISLNLVFLFIVSLDFLVYLFYRYQLETDSLYQKSLSSKISSDQLEKIISLRNTSYFSGPLINSLLFIGSTLSITGIIIFGLYLFDYVVNFKETLKAVLVGKVVFIGMSVINGVYFLFYKPESLLELRHRNLLSVQSLFSYDSLSNTEASALGAINIFEFAFMLLTATYLATFYRKNDGVQSFFRVILGSYGIYFFIFMLIKVYFSMNTK